MCRWFDSALGHQNSDGLTSVRPLSFLLGKHVEASVFDVLNPRISVNLRHPNIDHHRIRAEDWLWSPPWQEIPSISPGRESPKFPWFYPWLRPRCLGPQIAGKWGQWDRFCDPKTFGPDQRPPVTARNIGPRRGRVGLTVDNDLFACWPGNTLTVYAIQITCC